MVRRFDITCMEDKYCDDWTWPIVEDDELDTEW